MTITILICVLISYLVIGVIFWLFSITKHLKHEPWEEWVSSLFMVALGWPALIYMPPPRYLRKQMKPGGFMAPTYTAPQKNTSSLDSYTMLWIVLAALVLMLGFLLY